MNELLIPLKPFVNDPFVWEAFQNYLNHKLEMTDKRLEQEQDLLLIGRAQGEAALIRSLLKLREHVNGTDKTKSVPQQR